MQFFSPHDLSEVFGLPNQAGIAELIEQLKQYLKKDKEKEITIYGKHFNTENLAHFLEELKGEALIFIEWIRLHPGIKKALTRGDFTSLRIDNVIREHSLFTSFQKFITPYLKEKLKLALVDALEEENWSRVAELLGYTDLIVERSLLEVELTVVQYINSMLASLQQKCKGVDSERRLIHATTLLYHADFYRCLDALGKENYAVKLIPLEIFQKLLSHPTMIPQLAQNILSKIQLLHLNPHHNKKVDEFSLALRTGKLQFKKEKRQVRISKVQQWQKLVGAILLVSVLCVAFGFYLKDTKVNPPEIMHFQSGFDSISEGQMAMLDSLYKPVALEDENVENVVVDNFLGAPISLVEVSSAFTSIKNEKARNLKHDLLLDYDLQRFIQSRNTFIERCDELEETEGLSLNHIQVNEETPETVGHKFQNKSASDLYVVIYENVEQGKVSGRFIGSNSTVKLFVKEGDMMFFYTGSYMSPFIPAKTGNHGYGSKTYRQMLRGSLDYHFCYFSNENRAFLRASYVVGSSPETGKSVLHKTQRDDLKLVSTALTKVD
ncbi:hypothetical protein [Lishizhenia sp.]|uniref:hypothetical protein n=1 Tax=Lishizhenia sp. TaxID=2497594 RepID=UPI00299DB610|nr:hypothetical protein [Lishizhenia sp.]MDX1445436.1 hypothetical protein [Lishizhenia sp.]